MVDPQKPQQESQKQPRSKAPWIIGKIAAVVALSAGTSVLTTWYLNQRSLITSKPQKVSSKLQKVTIAQFGDFFLYAPLYLAIDAGFFEKQGLDASLISTGGDEKTWAAVISGNASFGVADPTFVAISESRGQPGKVIANIVNGVPFWGVTFNPNIKIETPKQLNNYSVATLPAPSTAYTLQKDMFLDAGLKPNIREGAFGALLPMLQAKTTDIALELEPNVSQAVADGANIVYSLASIYGDFAITGLTASPKLLEEKPELAQKVVCSIQMGLDFARKDQESALDILAKRFPEIDRNVASEALKRVVAEDIIPEDVVTEKTAWDKAISLREEVGDIKEPKDMQVYVNNTFAEEASKDCRIQ